MKTLFALIAAALAGCATEYVWQPQHDVETVRVVVSRDVSRCAVLAGPDKAGCAFLTHYDGRGWECHVFAHRAAWVDGHELAHCLGWRHQ